MYFTIKKGFYVCDMYMVKRALFHYIRGNLGCYVAADLPGKAYSLGNVTCACLELEQWKTTR